MTTPPPVSEERITALLYDVLPNAQIHASQNLLEWCAALRDVQGALRELTTARATIAALTKDLADTHTSWAVSVLKRSQSRVEVATLTSALTASVEEREKLQRELAGVRANDARYKFLRDQSDSSSLRIENEDSNEDGPTDTWYAVRGAEADAVVDEAMAEASAAIDSAIAQLPKDKP